MNKLIKRDQQLSTTQKVIAGTSFVGFWFFVGWLAYKIVKR